VSKKIEDPKLRLLLANQQVENLVALLEDNPYKPYLYQHLNPIKYEILRQLTNLNATDSNRKQNQS
jgi:hypothetical protein